jgi:hypothetical protein
MEFRIWDFQNPFSSKTLFSKARLINIMSEFCLRVKFSTVILIFLVTCGAAVPLSARDWLQAADYRYRPLEVPPGGKLNLARELQITTLESMFFLNRGEYFEARPLPPEAQFAPVFGMNIGDMDGDGQEDIFLAQNFFAVHLFTARLDGTRTLAAREREIRIKAEGEADFLTPFIKVR